MDLILTLIACGLTFFQIVIMHRGLSKEQSIVKQATKGAQEEDLTLGIAETIGYVKVSIAIVLINIGAIIIGLMSAAGYWDFTSDFTLSLVLGGSGR